ncbi:MAG: hypothetical protein Kapaf2KO_18900 [Candidatus Kapaibacteriales bacterium]
MPIMNIIKNLKSIIYIVGLFALVTSCSSTNNLYLTVTNPPRVYTSPDIKNIGLINRTKTSSDDNIFEKIEEIASAEAFGIDEEATNEILEGFGSNVTSYTKFDRVALFSIDDDTKLNIAHFPTPLTWKEIEEKCEAYDVDIIVELSFFDSNSQIDYSTRDKNIDIPIIGSKTVKEHIARVRTDYTCGWRVYDPTVRRITDEYEYFSSFSISGAGINPILAVREILQKRENLLASCRDIGNDYAVRFLPTRERVQIRYYVRGNDELELAKRFAQSGDWDAAGQIWDKLSSSSDPKIAGRATYNSAIYQEIIGNLDKALDLSQKAYALYEVKYALNYSRVLQTRIADREILDK